MKRLLMASDSFKGTLTSEDIISIANDVIRRGFPDWELDAQRIADGGEGTLEALSALLGGIRKEAKTIDAEGEEILAPILFLNPCTAFLESASVVGLPQIRGRVEPLQRTTKGLGILIREAIQMGARDLYLGLGGTSTCDLGIGMLQELGLDFHLSELATMESASRIQRISWGSFRESHRGVHLFCLSDVENKLLGDNGAVATFGPQKGYAGAELDYLERNFEKLSKRMGELTGIDLRSIKGGGAAGGLGASLAAFFSAPLLSGIDAILDLSHFRERAEQADLVITGEGCFDSQSLQGKAVSGIAKRVDPSKLVLLVGQNQMERPPFETWATSQKGELFEAIEKEAGQRYADTLAKILLSRS